MTTVDDSAAVASPIGPERYSWHDGYWATLTRDVGRLPHALLLYGQAGVGKNALALRLAHFLLCNKRDGDKQACADCRSCLLFRAGNHPDLLRIAPLEDSSNILVDQVRNVLEFLSLKPHTASHKIVIISPAEAMNANAANSLLKILEEPPAGSLLILVSPHLSRVSVTIRSRCMRVPIGVPPVSEALAWLQSQKVAPDRAQMLLALAGGAPLAALRFAEESYTDTQARLAGDLAALAQGRGDPITCAERWKTIGTEICLEWLHRFVVDTLRIKTSSSSDGNAVIQLQGGKSFSFSIIALFDFLDKVSIARRQLGTGVDEALMVEDLLIRWCAMTSMQ